MVSNGCNTVCLPMGRESFLMGSKWSFFYMCGTRFYWFNGHAYLRQWFLMGSMDLFTWESDFNELIGVNLRELYNGFNGDAYV